MSGEEMAMRNEHNMAFVSKAQGKDDKRIVVVFVREDNEMNTKNKFSCFDFKRYAKSQCKKKTFVGRRGNSKYES